MPGGCPGIPTTSVFGDKIGEVVINAGYPYPTLVNAATIAPSTMEGYHQDAYDNASSSLDPALQGAGGSCSCCCSEIMTGPTFMHQYNDCDEDYCCGIMTGWANRDYWPGGSSGVYMDQMSGLMWHFNVGQEEPCGEIRGGLYSFIESDDVDCKWYEWNTWWNGSGWSNGWVLNSSWNGECGKEWGFQAPALEYALFGHTPNQCYYHSAGAANGKWKICADNGAPSGGFRYLSLCLPCLSIDDATCEATCVNPQHYGHGIPTSATTGPGYSHNTTYAGSMFEDENCQSDPCSPNGMCFGPGGATGPGPTACFSNNSPLDGGGGFGTPDNVCYDCESKSIFHPCYDMNNSDTANNGSGPNGNNGGGGNLTCDEIYMPGIDSDGLPLTDWDAYILPQSEPGLFADNNKQTENWDNCCMYDVMGCVDSEYANYNGMARNGGYDCKGNPDPNVAFTSYDAGCGCIMCENVPTLPTGINTHPDLLDQNAALLQFDNPAPGPAVQCTTLVGSNNAPVHPLGWSNTNAKFTDTDCCSNAGCMDNGAGGTLWSNGAVPGPPGPTHAPQSPWPGPGPYYPGYNVLIGNPPTQITMAQPPVAASNYSAQFTQDCLGVPGGTNMSCCQYEITGCDDATAGPNPDIFGNGGYNVWNYNPYATVNDGSCFTEEPIGGCVDDGGLGLSVVSVPPFPPLYPGIPASNFNPNANIADTSCVWTEGCPDPYANNYDPCVVNPVTAPCTATYPVVPNPALCNYDIAGAGPGCMDPTALNFNPLSTQDCTFDVSYPGNCLGTSPGPYCCCLYPVEGCTDHNATNYNPLAVNDDGSCEYDISTTQEGVNWLYGSKVLLCRDPLTKEEVLMGVCDQPEIQSEIFIERGKQSVIEPNLRLGEITTMGGLTNHGYKYFRIKKQ